MEKSELVILIFGSITTIIFVIVKHKGMLNYWYVYENVFLNKFLRELSI